MKLQPDWVPARALEAQALPAHRWWPLAAPLAAACLLWLLGSYAETVQSVTATWGNSETYAHGYLVLPISLWLIWRRREVLAALAPRPDFRALPLLAVVGFGWLVAQIAGVMVIQQYAVVVMMVLAVWAVLGAPVVRELAFPLAFLLFGVPAGEFLLPVLMDQTADFTVLALRMSGVPVYREGLFFTIPSGSWSVVEACSGLRYLIACLTGGVLYAYFRYRSFKRRALFIAAAAVVPIVANWLRAYIIVMIDHLSNRKWAVDVDHLLYGWVFFGIVTLLLFWAGSYWREDFEPETQTPPAAPVRERAPGSLHAMVAATVAVGAIAAVWPVAAAWLDAPEHRARPVLETPLPGGAWQPHAAAISAWTPHFVSPGATVSATYASGGKRVGLYIGYYRDQRKGAELITSLNTLVGTSDSEWRNAGETGRSLDVGDGHFAVIEGQVIGRAKRLLAWRWYWVDGEYTANPYRAKLLHAKAKLFGRSDDGAVVIVHTDIENGRATATARLDTFVRDALPAITGTLQHAR